MPLCNSVAHFFVLELAAICDRVSYLASLILPYEPVRAFFESSFYSFAKRTADDYQYSHAHYLQPSSHTRNAFNQLISHQNIDPSSLAIMHIRYDEHEWFFKPQLRFHGDLCLRVKLFTRKNDANYWAPLEQIVKSVSISSYHDNTQYLKRMFTLDDNWAHVYFISFIHRLTYYISFDPYTYTTNTKFLETLIARSSKRISNHTHDIRPHMVSCKQ